MKILLAAPLAFAAGLALTTPNAAAVGICKCDSATGFKPVCLPICNAANAKTKFFRPAVYFGADKSVSADKTPLNGTSMKFIYLENPTRKGMEDFRRFLEKHRKNAEAAFRKSNRAYRRGKISDEEFRAAEKRRDEAMVNYYHAMRAYLTIPSPR